MNHAYGIIDVIELDEEDDDLEPVRLLLLRNPWGQSEWLGAFGTGSEELETYRTVLTNYIKTLPDEEHFKLDDDDGKFFMHYDDWKDTFTNLFINNDFPDDWCGVRFRSAWTKSNSAGLPRSYTK